MRSSRICLIILSILVVQISSELTELDKILNKIKSSAFETAATPFKGILNEVQTNSDLNKYLREYSQKVKRLMEETQEALFNVLPNEERGKTKKIIGYLSLYASAAFSKAANGVTYVTNKSFDTLPDDIKTKLLDFGKDIDDFLRKLNVTIDNDSNTSQKNPE